MKVYLVYTWFGYGVYYEETLNGVYKNESRAKWEVQECEKEGLKARIEESLVIE